VIVDAPAIGDRRVKSDAVVDRTGISVLDDLDGDEVPVVADADLGR
jgi:hypothetical protein